MSDMNASKISNSKKVVASKKVVETKTSNMNVIAKANERNPEVNKRNPEANKKNIVNKSAVVIESTPKVDAIATNQVYDNSGEVSEKMEETYDELRADIQDCAKEVNNLKKLMIYLVILCFVLLYIALFFIHPIVDIGNSGDAQSGDTTNPGNVMGESEDNNKNNGNQNNDGNNSNGNQNNGDNGIGYGNSNMGDNSNSGNGTGNNGNGGNNQGDNIVDNMDRFRIYEGAKQWSELKELSIFKNGYFEDESKIAPGVQGVYSFTVENYVKSTIKYSINFSEDNPYNVNMVYKLKVNGKYVAGNDSNWVKPSQLNQENLVINSNSNDIWTIEWKWEDAANDTQVGMTDGANYKLNVTAYAEII